MENCIAILREYNIRVRLDFTTLTPEEFSLESLQAVWKKHAQMLTQNGEIFPSCSVHLLDWDRVVAFFEHFDTISKESLEKMRDKIILLNGSNLGLCTASPYSAAAIAQSFSIEVPAPQYPGEIFCHPKLRSEVSESAVRAEIVEIKKRIKEYTVLAEQSEYHLANDIGEKSMALENLGRAKRMRFITALAWQLNADALPDNAKEQEEATEAVKAYLVHTNYIQQPEQA